MDLRPCQCCHRHVRTDERACPFCTTALEPGRAQSVTPRSRSRAALFFATLAACGSGEKPADQQPPPKPIPADAAEPRVAVDAAPIAPVVEDAGVAEVVDAAVAKPDPEAVRKWREAQKKREEKMRVPPPNKPYGAPPARKRVV